MASNLNDLINVQRGVNAGAGGNDTYILSPSAIDANAVITISDTQGVNKIQLIGGLSITSSVVASGTAELTLSNGAKITILGADTFSFITGGNPLTDPVNTTTGVTKTYTNFVTDILGTTVPTTGTSTGSVSTINTNGTSSVVLTPVFSVTGTTAVLEGATASFDVNLTNHAAGVAYSVTTTLAATGTATAVTDFASTLTLDAASITAGVTLVAGVLTIPTTATLSKVTLSTTVALDGISPEAGEGLSLTLSNATGGTGTGAAIVLATASSVTTTITDVPTTFSLTASASSVLEGAAATFTVRASQAVLVDTEVTFKVVVADALAPKQGSSSTNLDDFAAGSFNPSVIKILAGQTDAVFTVTGANDGLTELPENYSVTADITGQTQLTKTMSMLDGAGNFTLTKSVDSGNAFTGGTGNDSFTANYDTTTTAAHTLGVLDVLDGGAGTADTLAITNDDGEAGAFILAAATISNIETMTIRGAGAVTADVSGSNITGLNTLSVTKATDVTVTASATQDVNVSGAVHADADISVTGGKTVTVNHKLDSAGDSISVNGAVNVNVTATDVIDADGINIGTTTANTGTVVVNASGAAITAATAGITMDAIAVTGGTTISVNQDATSNMGTATTDTTANTITQGAVTVVSGTTTTTVTVTQDKTVAAVNAAAAVAAVASTSVVTFGLMAAAGDSVTVNGLTFTAAKALTANEVAAAFANLTLNDLQINGGVVANGIFTGSNTASFTTGAVSGATVTYSSPTTATPAVGATGTAVAPTATAGTTAVAAVTAVTGVLGVANGDVRVDGDAANTLTTVTLDGYASADLGSTGADLNGLTTLSLANSTGAATVVTTAPTLALKVNNVNHTVTLTDASLKTLNVTTATANSLG